MTEDQAKLFEAALSTKAFGRPLRFYPFAVTSEALAMAWARQEKGPEGATVVADLELSPRQRKGPPWIPFPSLGLYFALVLRPGLPPDGEGLLWMLSSLGAAEGLAKESGLDIKMKWPDDLLVNGKKIGGLKVEAQLGPGEIVSAVVTARININVSADAFPEALRDRATSVLIETGRPLELPRALNAVLGGIEARYEEDDVSKMLQAYLERCETIGKKVRAVLLPKGEVAGLATGIDPFGALQIEVGGRTVPVVIDTLKKLEEV